MSIELMTLVWKVPFPTSTQMLIALKLADHAESDGTSVYPGKGSLAERARCSVSTVKNTLRLMREAGILIVVREGGKTGPHDTTEYRMNVGLLDAIARGEVSITGSSDSIVLACGEDGDERGPIFDPLDFDRVAGSPVPGQPAGATRVAGSPQPINKHHKPSGAQARAGDADAPLAPAAKKRWLVLREDNDWWKWVSVAEHHYPGKGRKMFEEEGGMVVFDEVPVASACQPPKLPPPSGSALYDDLVKARGKALTDRSRAMAGDREDVG